LSWWFEVEGREVSGLALAWFVRPLIGPLPSPAASEHHHHSQQHHTMRSRPVLCEKKHQIDSKDVNIFKVVESLLQP
jgi:hypothetical protein